MVMPDIGDDTQLWDKDVGRIQTTSQTCFQHDDIHLLAHEPFHGQMHIDIKHGQLQCVPALLVTVDEREKDLWIHPHIIDTDTIVMRLQRR